MKGCLCLSECVTKKGAGACGVVCLRINVYERQGVCNWGVDMTQSMHGQGVSV